MKHAEAGAARARRPDLDKSVLAFLCLVEVLVRIPGLFRYGYFRDELYYLDCGRHLAAGYVDHAPLVALYAKLALLMGGSLPALRILPLFAEVGTMALTVLLCRQLGGGRYAQLLAGLAFLVAPVHLTLGSILSMNAFEPWFWLGGVLVMLRIVETGDSRLWLLFGALAGLGLLNKHSTLFFGFAVAVAVLLTPLRRELARPWIWLGAVVALLVFLPNLLWQWQHDFPTLVDLRNVRAIGKNVELSPLAFLGQQVLVQHPITAPIWIAGLLHLLFGRGRRYRFVAWIFLVLFFAMMALHGKDYYLAPAYPMLFAAGAVAVAQWIEGRRRAPALRAAVVAAVGVAGILLAPMALPVLAPQRLVALQQALGVTPQKSEVAHEGPLPQIWGDQFGWPELVDEVARIYHALPPEERSRTAIYASNYGEAGAIDLFGPGLGLPRAVCAHQSYSFWGGPPAEEPQNLIWLQWRREWLEDLCDSVEQVGEHFHPWGMAEENRPIYLCRGLRTPLRELWPELVHWN